MIAIVTFAIGLSAALSEDTCKASDASCATRAPNTPAEYCTDAACCKKRSKNKWSSKLCDDFYNPSVGAAYTMFTDGGWWRETVGLPYSIFHFKPSQKRFGEGDEEKEKETRQQWSTGITHSGKRACPYPNAGPYGVIMDVSKDSRLWKHFQVCKNHPDGVCGQCTDGFKCGIDHRTPVEYFRKNKGGMTYDEFRKRIDPIIEATGTSSCNINHPTSYNEFNLNGLSAGSVRGLLIPECLQSQWKDKVNFTMPSIVKQVCPALVAQGGPGNWPVYVYDNGGMAANGNYGPISSLRIDRHIFCALGR